MPFRQAHFQKDTAYRVMRLLEHNPDLIQRELAQHRNRARQTSIIMFSNRKRTFLL